MSEGDLRRRSSEIQVGASDAWINQLLANHGAAAEPTSATAHFDQSEEFFLKLPGAIEIPAFPIHHDVHQVRPSKSYLANIRRLVEQLVAAVPTLLGGLTYVFDPADTLHPAFFRLYQLEGREYLYLAKVSLRQRGRDIEILVRGTNDMTPQYRTTHLHLEPALIPLDGVERVDGQIRSFTIRRTISQTWMGERGRGYFVQGIWMDAELSKFFSRLLFPQGLRTYPYYPYMCKYRTVCLRLADPHPSRRESQLPVLHQVVEFLEPEMEAIQTSLRRAAFSEDLPLYTSLHSRTPPAWLHPWQHLSVRPYLNEHDMREFQVDLDGG